MTMHLAPGSNMFLLLQGCKSPDFSLYELEGFWCLGKDCGDSRMCLSASHDVEILIDDGVRWGISATWYHEFGLLTIHFVLPNAALLEAW